MRFRFAALALLVVILLMVALIDGVGGGGPSALQERTGEAGSSAALARSDLGFGALVVAGATGAVAFWESEEALQATEEAVSGVRSGAADAAGGTVAGVEQYEVFVYEAPSTGPVSGVTDTVGGVTDTVGGTTDNLLGGGEKER